MLSRIMHALVKGKTLLANHLRRIGDARRRRIEHDREFYRKLKAYCRASNISAVCEDDWRTWAGDKGEDEASNPR
jgi:hypothetical protein